MRFSLIGASPRRLLLVLGLAGTAAGCDSLLDIDNPATYGPEDLTTLDVAPQLVNGVVGRFNGMYDDLALNSAVITDEAVTGNNFETVQRVDLRQITKENSTDVYSPIQLTRAAADSFEARLVRLMPDSASRALGVARVQAYGAMTYVLAGEYLCDSPVDPASPVVTPDSMFGRAISYANRAIATAQAYKAFRNSTGSGLRADSMINLARLVAARAHLNRGQKAEAAAFAAQVNADFRIVAAYNVANVNNIFQSSTQGANRNLGVDVTFRNLNDPRVRYNTTGGTGHDSRTILFSPFQAPSFTGYSATTNVDFARETGIVFASGLEARYIMAEAQGPSATNVTFINSRIKVGAPTTADTLVAPTQGQFLTVLQDQRRRDFFLDGHRQGDLRRYIKLYNQNFYPTGVHPTPERGTYGTDVCFPPTQAEIVGNPQV